ncbi:hypothetical protein QJS10_CPA02g00266 [Acorus calamus]|uniref:C2H2-type domain-containing protein n=1 Tax=Acorus calamus TaxID=4465 RepID=A0AAV9FFH1_ACOCL|nr:hypothetical protein QJS10_CPA02g00266 [Acorus calamus]
MNLLCKPVTPSHLPNPHHPLPTQSFSPPKPTLHFSSPNPPIHPLRWTLRPTPASSAAPEDVDMVRGADGVYSAKPKKVVVLWDLDNKPPRGPPYDAALSLRRLASSFGEILSISAYANRHAFVHLPQWVIDSRRDRRTLDVLERKGAVSPPPGAYACGVCGRKCRTHLELKRHFKQLHERERLKKLGRMRSLKGKKRQKYKERFVSGNTKYEEAAREILTPKVGYGLASELRRAGVFVKTVEDKPQAADSALKRQVRHSVAQGVDWLFLVSDDSDFSETLRRVREFRMRTVVVGDGRGALGKCADLWVPWEGVEGGEVGGEVLMEVERGGTGFVAEEALFSGVEFDECGGRELDRVVDEIVMKSVGCAGGVQVSVFSEEEGLGERGGGGGYAMPGSFMLSEDLFWESDEEDDYDDDDDDDDDGDVL